MTDELLNDIIKESRRQLENKTKYKFIYVYHEGIAFIAIPFIFLLNGGNCNMNEKTKCLVWSSLFLAVGIVIPYIFHVTGLPGQVFLPMHIPVLLCGLILGEKYGILVGILSPLINSAILGMPPIFPTGISMVFELGTYGATTGLLYKKGKCNIIVSLISAMILGRVVSGFANYILLTAGGSGFVLSIFITGTFVKGVWGMGIQLILIPILIKAIERVKKGNVLINE